MGPELQAARQGLAAAPPAAPARHGRMDLVLLVLLCVLCALQPASLAAAAAVPRLAVDVESSGQLPAAVLLPWVSEAEQQHSSRPRPARSPAGATATSPRRELRVKSDDGEAVMDPAMMAEENEDDHVVGEEDDFESDLDHHWSKPSRPKGEDMGHHDPHRDHRDVDHASLGQKHLEATKKSFNHHQKKQYKKNLKKMNERIHDSVSRPEL